MKLNSFNEKPDFNFFVPIDFEKGKNEKTGEKVMKIRGIASTADKDSEGEILDPTGFDLSRFLEIGYLNYNHLSKSDPSKVIGEPTAANITRNGDLYFEGFLYNGHSTAESVYQMAETLERNGSKRKIGLSIEGRALERNPTNPKHITKALLTGLAITMTPVNGATYMEIVKGTQKQDFTEYEEDMLQKAEDSKYIFEFSCDSKKYGITKTFSVEEIIEKDMTTSNTAALTPESLDGKKIKLEPEIRKAIKLGILPIENLLKKLKR